MQRDRPPTALFKQLHDGQVSAARALVAGLSVTPREYPLIADDRAADHRSFALRRAAEHLLVAVTSGWRAWDYYFRNEDRDEVAAPAENAELWGIIDEQAGWQRRLFEVLVDLILFGQSNEQIFFHMYLLTEQIERLVGIRQELSTFWGCRNEVAERRASSYLGLLQKLISEVHGEAWFLGDELSLALKRRRMPRRIPLVQSFRQRMLKALECGTEEERLALGSCYMPYSLVSSSAHARLTEEHQPHNMQDLQAVLTWGLVLGFPILRRCQELSGIILDDLVGTMSRDPNFLSGFVAGHALNTQKLEPGDLVVVASNDIAEIIRVTKGKYGNSNFTVKALTQPLVDRAGEISYPDVSARLLCRRDDRRDVLVQLARGRGDLERIRTGSVLLESAVADQLRDELSRLTGQQAQRLLSLGER